MYHIINPKDHEEWLEERLKGIGASDAGTLMCSSPFNSPRKLWQLRKGVILPDPPSEAMEDGHDLELATTAAFIRMTGAIIDYSTCHDWLAVDDEKEFLRVSPDRMYWPKGTPKEMQTRENWELLELKSTSERLAEPGQKQTDPSVIPLYWFCQVQYQMGVLGKKKAAVCWFQKVSPSGFHYCYVDFNPVFYKTLKETITQFWEYNILQNVEPPAINAEDVLLSNPYSEPGKKIIASEDDIRNHEELTEIRRKIQEMEIRAGELEDSLKVRMNDGELLVVPDADEPDNEKKMRTLAKWASVNTSFIDESRLKKDNPALYSQYVETKKTFDSRRFKAENPTGYKEYEVSGKGSRRFRLM